MFYIKAIGLGEPAEVLLAARVPGRIFWKGINGRLLPNYNGHLICSLVIYCPKEDDAVLPVLLF